VAKSSNQGANIRAALMQLFEQPIEASSVELVPLWWNFCGDAPKLIDIHFFCACESRFEVILVPDVRVDTIAWVNTTKRRIGEAPLPGIEAISLIDKDCSITAALGWAAEDGLTPVRVTGPFV
jgi:hypothetical protein